MRLLKIAAVASALACLSFPPAARAAEAVPATLTVTGEGRVSRAPDLATVSASIVTSDDNASRALSENNRRYAALTAKLAAAGVAANDMQSDSIQSYFNPRPSGQAIGAAGQLFGFIVTRNVRINVAVLAQTGAVIDAATAAGATQIGGVSYGFRDRRARERAAQAAAVSDAYAQAQAIAAAAHVEIVRVLRIGLEPGTGRVVPFAMTMARSAEPPVPTTISPSDLSVESSLSVTYVIR